MDVYVRLSTRSAEEAFASARTIGGDAGFAVDADLVTGVGPAIVSALDGLGPVFVAAVVSGSPTIVGATISRLARLGATWVTVAGSAGPQAVAAAVAGVAGTGCSVAVHTIPIGLDDATVATLTGSTRGKQVSRLAAVAAASGAKGVICAVPDLGVVAQVAPGLARIVDGDVWQEASRRGAEVLLLPSPAALAAFLAESDAPRQTRSRTRRR